MLAPRHRKIHQYPEPEGLIRMGAFFACFASLARERHCLCWRINGVACRQMALFIHSSCGIRYPGSPRLSAAASPRQTFDVFCRCWRAPLAWAWLRTTMAFGRYLMENLASSAFCVLFLVKSAPAIDFTGFATIDPLASYTSTRHTVTIACRDQSQVRLYILAPDLIRVRASFRAPMPDRDQSWAIAKTAWDVPKWSVKEEPDDLLIASEEVEVIVHRSPLLIEFRDAKTHRTINRDALPMMWDPHVNDGRVVALKKLGFDEHFYGLGEKAARFDKRRGQFTMWNSDTPAYQEGTDPIYQDIPFYLGWQSAEAYGIFFDNSYRTHFDFAGESPDHVVFEAEGGEMNYYFFWGPSIKKILGRYADLTGHLPMPPKWALGNQQSRWSYYPDTVAEEVVRRYRAEDLPLDVLHLDIDYMQQNRVFTWDRHGYPDPTAFTEKLRKQGVKVVVIVDPGVKYQPPEPGAANTAANQIGRA